MMFMKGRWWGGGANKREESKLKAFSRRVYTKQTGQKEYFFEPIMLVHAEVEEVNKSKSHAFKFLPK